MVKILEQYTTKLSPEEHQALQEAVKWLSENGFLKKTNKYEVTRYALKTLVDIVESKKKKIKIEKEFKKGETVLEKSSEKKETVLQKESEQISGKKTPNELSNGGQGA